MILNEFEAPYLDQGIKEELENFIARRKSGVEHLPIIELIKHLYSFKLF